MSVARLIEAAEHALRVRGIVMLSAAGDEERWCAICAAIDGSLLEVRVGEPLGGWLRRRQRREEERWLRDHGFVHGFDAWTAPAPYGATPSWCAHTLSAALEHAFEVPPGAELAEVLVHPGFLDESRAAPPDAPHADHVRAALHQLVRHGRGHVGFAGGRPSSVWGGAHLVDGELVLDPVSKEPDPAYEVEWSVALDPSEVDTAAERLTAVMHDRPGRSAADPFLVQFMQTGTGHGS